MKSNFRKMKLRFKSEIKIQENEDEIEFQENEFIIYEL